MKQVWFVILAFMVIMASVMLVAHLAHARYCKQTCTTYGSTTQCELICDGE